MTILERLLLRDNAVSCPVFRQIRYDNSWGSLLGMNSDKNFNNAFAIRPLPPLSEFKIRWSSVIIYSLLHAGVVAGFWFFSWPAFWIGLASGYIPGFIGISVGYHRLMAHKAFETYPAVKIFHLFLAAVGMQLGPITWVRTHVRHHARADTDEDPHTQIYGLFWGICGWLFLSHPRIGKSPLSRKLRMSELNSDPIVVFFEKHWFNIFLLSFVPLYLIGGWTFVCWVGCFRVVSQSYYIWILNALGHRTGRHTFPTYDRSTNSLIIALLSGGEGWHNNHHNFPASARFGLQWYQIDFGYMWICLLKKMGLAWNIKSPAIYAPDPTGPINVKNFEEMRSNLNQSDEDIELSLLQQALTGERPVYDLDSLAVSGIVKKS
jgi:fatty-acid desaturase